MKSAMPFNVSGQSVFRFQNQTLLSHSELKCQSGSDRGISYYFRIRINFRLRDFSTSPPASPEMTNEDERTLYQMVHTVVEPRV